MQKEKYGPLRAFLKLSHICFYLISLIFILRHALPLQRRHLNSTYQYISFGTAAPSSNHVTLPKGTTWTWDHSWFNVCLHEHKADKRIGPINANPSQHLERAAASGAEIARGDARVGVFNCLHHWWMLLKYWKSSLSDLWRCLPFILGLTLCIWVYNTGGEWNLVTEICPALIWSFVTIRPFSSWPTIKQSTTKNI